MYLEKIKRGYKCSEKTLQDLIDNVDINSLEVAEDAITEIRVIDPPVVNGITLTEHPNAYQRARYRKIYDNGGIVCQLYINNVPQYMVIDLGNGKIGKNISEFEPIRADNVTTKVSRQIENVIASEFENVKKKGPSNKKRPKSMSSDDFWAQFNTVELQNINMSFEQEVKDFILAIDGMNKVPLNNAIVKAGINMLNVNLLLSGNTYSELTEV